MSTKLTPAPDRNALSARLGCLSRALIAPAATFDDMATRHTSWLLAIAMFSLMILTVVVNSPAYDLARAVQYLVLSLFLAGIFVLWRRLAALATVDSAEAALRDSEERYRVISELISDYAFAYRLDADGSGVLEWVTDAMTRITGYTPEDMRTVQDWERAAYPEDLPIVLQRRHRLHAGRPDVSEYRIVAKDGRILWFRFYSRPVWDAAAGRVVRVYGAVQDITQIKQLQEQLAQAQKMEAIGRLAGGIAHDFNNLLTVILSNIELLLAALADDDDLRQDAEQIQQAARRSAALTQQLLAFSRRQVLKPRRLDLNTVVADIAQLLKRLIGADIELVTQLGSELWQVNADPGQIEQVLMNLAVNGRDAMPMGGILTITTANVDLHDAELQGRFSATCGSYVVIAVQDTGVGMDAATRARIFEPFFTTKAPGKGTGLGLATVHGIVTQSGGYIVVDSAPGQGSTFAIYLPRANAVEERSSAD